MITAYLLIYQPLHVLKNMVLVSTFLVIALFILLLSYLYGIMDIQLSIIDCSIYIDFKYQTLYVFSLLQLLVKKEYSWFITIETKLILYVTFL